MTNVYEINDLIEFVHKYDITIKQFTYCLLLHYDKRHSRIEGSSKISRPLSKMYKYHQNIEKFKKSEIQDLINKDLLQQTGETYKPDMLEPTQKFIKEWYGDSLKVKELIDIYPKKIDNFNHPSGGKIPLCTFDDFNKLKDAYNYNVKTDKMHQRVLDLVEWAKENDALKLGIVKFVNSKYWEELQEMREDEVSTDNQTVI